MARKSTKKFDFGKGIYYFNIRSGANSNITIKRIDKDKAVAAYKSYLLTRKECEWLGKWNGKKFEENNFDEVSSTK